MPPSRRLRRRKDRGKKNGREKKVEKKPPAPLTPERMYAIIKTYPVTSFQGCLGRDMFMSTLDMLINDLRYSDLVKEIMANFSNKKGEIIDSIKKISQIMVDNKVTGKNEKFNEQWNKYIGGFKKGDELPAGEGEIQAKIKEFVRNSFPLRTVGNRAYAADTVNNVINKYGFNIRHIPDKSHITFDPYTARSELIAKKKKGAIDTTPDNAKDFFTYDIHKIYSIIEKGLGKKLTDSLKNDIEAIIDQETRNMRYHTNISHGVSTVQSIIADIEDYINSRIKDKSKSFKFTEANRYRLKIMLTEFLNQ